MKNFFFYFWIVIGCVLLIVAGVMFAINLNFALNARKTTGFVEEYRTRGNSYYPIVVFKTSDGQEIRFISNGKGASDFFLHQTVPVLYNPTQPKKAEIRSFKILWLPSLFFGFLGLIAATVGFGTMFLSREGERLDVKIKSNLKEGLKLWQAYPDWRDGRIVSKLRTDIWIYWLMAFFWNSISSLPMIIFLPREIGRGNYPALLGLFFPIVGIGLIVTAVRKTLQWRKFGQLALVMDPFPGSIGGDVGGTIEVPIAFGRKKEFRMSLSCIHVTITRGKNRYKTEKLLWQEHGKTTTEIGADGTRLKFKFHVPKELPVSELPSYNFHQWIVRVQAELPGIDLDRSFMIPVFDMETPLLSKLDATPAVQAPARSLYRAVKVNRMANKLILIYPAARNRKNGLMMLLMGMVFMSMVIFVFSGFFHSSSPSSFGGVATIWNLLAAEAAIMFPIFGLIGLMMILYPIYLLGNSLSVHIGNGSLQTVRKIFGITVLTRVVQISGIESIQLKWTSQRGEGVDAKVFYTVKAHTNNGKKITVGDGIEGLREAEEIKKMISEACNLKDTWMKEEALNKASTRRAQ